MSTKPAVSLKAIERALKRAGWAFERDNGGHRIFQSPDGENIFPVQKGKPSNRTLLNMAADLASMGVYLPGYRPRKKEGEPAKNGQEEVKPFIMPAYKVLEYFGISEGFIYDKLKKGLFKIFGREYPDGLEGMATQIKVTASMLDVLEKYATSSRGSATKTQRLVTLHFTHTLRSKAEWSYADAIKAIEKELKKAPIDTPKPPKKEAPPEPPKKETPTDFEQAIEYILALEEKLDNLGEKVNKIGMKYVNATQLRDETEEIRHHLETLGKRFAELPKLEAIEELVEKVSTLAKNSAPPASSSLEEVLGILLNNGASPRTVAETAAALLAIAYNPVY